MLRTIKKTLRRHLGERVYNQAVLPRHYAESVAAAVRYGFPGHGMLVIGVTGTNGKTTTCNMLASILTAAGHKVGLLSSATLQFGSETQENDIHLSTGSGRTIQKLLAQMKRAGCDVAVIEVTSHALVQGRVWGIPFDAAVMTNLSQDHLDYHGDMKRYAAAKARLFKRARSLSVLNIDDAYFTTFERVASGQARTYGQAQLADTRLVKMALREDGANFSVETDERASHFHINLTGQFNVYNALAAITVARFYELDDETIQRGLLALKSVPGRMQRIDEGQPFTVIIDHAHTEDALKNLFTELKKIAKKRIIVVIGCDGDRDKGKRKPIGKLSAEFGDAVYLTELENYTEDSLVIRDMVRKGMEEVPPKKRARIVEIVDRREAIAAALKEAKTGDLVIIPGLGNQDYRGMAKGKIAWDDREVVREELRALKPKR